MNKQINEQTSCIKYLVKYTTYDKVLIKTSYFYYYSIGDLKIIIAKLVYKFGSKI